ncbi:hypothetical protein [Enterococcus sp. AZ196]|uniref:hypothetical protein n=1 Tax=Enterococcus sp. AZ196 TaxID=2774659 RepID=UPI003D2A8985
MKSHEMKDKIQKLLSSGVTGKQVETSTGISKSNFYNLKNGSTSIEKINYETVVKLADFYDKQVELKTLETNREEYLEFVTNIQTLGSDIKINKSNSINRKAFKEVMNEFFEEMYHDQGLVISLFDSYKEKAKR